MRQRMKTTRALAAAALFVAASAWAQNTPGEEAESRLDEVLAS